MVCRSSWHDQTIIINVQATEILNPLYAGVPELAIRANTLTIHRVLEMKIIPLPSLAGKGPIESTYLDGILYVS